MARIVIRFERTLNGPSQVRLEEPARHPNADDPLILDLENAQSILKKFNAAPLPADAIKEAGAQLAEMLALHPAIKADVVPLLDQQNATETPIYLVLKNTGLEPLPWEALYTPNAGFVSCDHRWAVARAQRVAEGKPEAKFVPPLKVMAILGASGDDALTRISADREWEALYASLKATRLNVKLKVLVCEEDLKKRIDAENRDWIGTGLLATEDLDGRDLFQIIGDFAPHILHFFCHGAAAPFPRLEVGTQLDWEKPQRGSIQIEGPQLRQRADPGENIWLVTLNCCESAMKGDAEGSRSLPMASALVSAGFPAVVGMRERVESDLAHVFCRLFYEGLLTDLTQRIEAAENDAIKEIHWACALYSARQRICETVVQGAPFTESAASLKEWTIPVLFTRLQAFRLRLVASPNDPVPVFRPEQTATKPPAKAAGPATLTGQQIRELAEEMEQLVADRERFKALAPVVRKIDARLAEIEKQLNV